MAKHKPKHQPPAPAPAPEAPAAPPAPAPAPAVVATPPAPAPAPEAPAPAPISWAPIVDRAAQGPAESWDSVLKQYAGLVVGREPTEAEMAAGRVLIGAAVVAKSRERALVRLRDVVKGFTVPDSLRDVAILAAEAGTSLTVGITVVDGAPHATLVIGAPPAAPRPAAAPGAVTMGARGRPATFPTVDKPGGAAGVIFDGAPVTSAMLRTDPRLAEASAYLNRGAAGKTMPNGKTYADGSNFNAGQALLSWLAGPVKSPAMLAAAPLVAYGNNR